jgi:hypothetical protein
VKPPQFISSENATFSKHWSSVPGHLFTKAGKNPIFFHYKIGFLVLMKKTRFLLYKTWFYFGVGQAPGHPHPCRCHYGKGKIECQTLVINIIAINKLIKTRL